MAKSLQSIISLDNEISNLGLTTLNDQAFTSGGTFNVPTNFRGFLYVTLVGGGGGGGGNTSNFAPGGGAIYYRWPCWVDYASTPTISVTIGAGGAAGGAGVYGGMGGNSTFGNFLIAFGGSGGSDNSSTISNIPGGYIHCQWDARGYTASSGPDDGGNTYIQLHPKFPAWGEIIHGWYCAGGHGGYTGNQDAVMQTYTSASKLYATSNATAYDGPNNPVSIPSTGTGAGEGGNSWGKGATSGADAAANGGGGGWSLNGGGGRAGAAGWCFVEWFT